MVKVWFPNMYMKLISLKMKKSPPQAVLQVQPSMTKTEIKEYLTKIYNVTVQKVATMNYLGKWKRLYAKRRIISYKRRNYKVATVTFDDKPAKPLL